MIGLSRNEALVSAGKVLTIEFWVGYCTRGMIESGERVNNNWSSFILAELHVLTTNLKNAWLIY